MSIRGPTLDNSRLQINENNSLTNKEFYNQEHQNADKSTSISYINQKEIEHGKTINLEKQAIGGTVREDLVKSVSRVAGTSVIVNLVTYPMNVKATRAQLGLSSGPQSLSLETIKDLYKGYGFKVLTHIPHNLAFYYTYSKLNHLFDSQFPNHGLVNSFAALAGATFTDATIANPTSFLLTRLQAGNSSCPEKTKDILTIVKNIYKEGHIFNTFYRGYPALISSKLSFTIPYFIGLDQIESMLLEDRKRQTPASEQLLYSVMAGFTSGLVASTISFPFDMISKIQKNSDIQVSLLETAKKIYAFGGLKGFYRGAFIGICVQQPAHCITTAVVLKLVDLGLQGYLKNKIHQHERCFTKDRFCAVTSPFMQHVYSHLGDSFFICEHDIENVDEYEAVKEIANDSASQGAELCKQGLSYLEDRSKKLSVNFTHQFFDCTFRTAKLWRDVKNQTIMTSPTTADSSEKDNQLSFFP